MRLGAAIYPSGRTQHRDHLWHHRDLAQLTFDHLGTMAMAILTFSPCGESTRNVLVRSENPTGTRGHTLIAQRSLADIRYARFLSWSNNLRPSRQYYI
jgi:hypothetical protein